MKKIYENALTVKEAIYSNSIQDMILILTADNRVVAAKASPIRAIKEEELRVMPGIDASRFRVCGVPLPDYLWRFYGLERETEPAKEAEL